MGEVNEAERREQEGKAGVKWLQEKWGDDKPCPYCGGVAWSVAPPVYLVHNNHDDLYRSPPMLVVRCGTCGHTMFIDAIIAGVVSREEFEALGETTPDSEQQE
jgi:ribosomal protein S27AE